MNSCIDCGAVCGKFRRCKACAFGNKDNARRRCARNVEMNECEKCGKADGLARHHPDIKGQPDLVQVLCWGCHSREDQMLGKWGNKAGPPKRDRPADEVQQAMPDFGDGASVVMVMGPSGAGKSEMVRRLMDEEGFRSRFVSVETEDMYRAGIHYDLIPAEVYKELVEHGEANSVIVETSGVDARIWSIVRGWCIRHKKTCKAMILTASSQELEGRILKRGKEPLFGTGTEGLLRWNRGVLHRLPVMYPESAGCVWIDVGCGLELAYAKVKKVVAAFSLE